MHLNVHALLTWVLLHEYLHVEYPAMSEGDVSDRTDRAMKHLPKSAIIELAEKVLERLWTTEPGCNGVHPVEGETDDAP